MVGSAAVGAWAAGGRRAQIEVEYRDIKVAVDDKVLTMDAEPFLHVAAGRTFVPARFVAEALGGKVTGMDATNTVRIYTDTYATSKRDGDTVTWTNPAHGFSIQTPAGFVKTDMKFFYLQLNQSTADGTAIVAVHRLPAEMAGAPAGEKILAIAGSMTMLLQDVQLTGTTAGEGKTVVTGTAQMGGSPMTFTVTLLPSAQGDWALISLVPTARAEALAPTLQAIFGSFQAQ